MMTLLEKIIHFYISFLENPAENTVESNTASIDKELNIT